MIQKKIYLEGVDPVKLFGINNARFDRIKESFPRIKIVSRGSELTLKGEEAELLRFEKGGVAARFYNLNRDAKLKLWDYIKDN